MNLTRECKEVNNRSIESLIAERYSHFKKNILSSIIWSVVEEAKSNHEALNVYRTSISHNNF